MTLSLQILFPSLHYDFWHQQWQHLWCCLLQFPSPQSLPHQSLSDTHTDNACFSVAQACFQQLREVLTVSTLHLFLCLLVSDTDARVAQNVEAEGFVGPFLSVGDVDPFWHHRVSTAHNLVCLLQPCFGVCYLKTMTSKAVLRFGTFVFCTLMQENMGTLSRMVYRPLKSSTVKS